MFFQNENVYAFLIGSWKNKAVPKVFYQIFLTNTNSLLLFGS